MITQPLSKKFSEVRRQFPMLSKTMHGHPLVYFDSAATAQKPQAVIDAIHDFYQNHYGTVHRAVYDLSIHSTQVYQEVRTKIQHFLNAAKPEEIIYTRGATESINLVAYSFGKAFVSKGDAVVISQIEHHSNIVPWQMLCEDRGAVLRIIPCNDLGELDLAAYAKLLEEKPKIVAITHVSNALGTINPIKKMIAMAHQAGAKVLIDGAQAAPHLSIDVQDLDADFYVFAGHKAFGPTGIGILYGKSALLEAMPPYQGGGDMIEKVTFQKTTYNVLPLKFEAGTPMIAEVIGLGEAIEFLLQLGMDNIAAWEHELLIYATSKMKQIPGLHIIGNAKDKGAIISFVIDGVHSLDIGTMLDLKGIAIRTGHHCAQPTMVRFGVTATARVSLALYNTFEEVDYFVQSLADVAQLLKQG